MIVGLLTLVTLAAFEAMAVASAMPEVARALNSVRNYSLAFSLFLTTSLLGTVIGGSWADARGPLRPTLVGVAAFVVGLVICGLATTFPMLLAGRALSGVGGGLMVVSMYVALALGYDEDERPQAFGYISAAWVVPALVGPTIAGWLTEAFSWRWVFLGVVPFGVLAMAVLWRPLAALPPATTAAPPAASTAAPPATSTAAPLAPPAGNPVADAAVEPGHQINDGQGAEVRRRILLGLALATGAAVGQWAAQHVVGGTWWHLGAALAGVVAVLATLPALVPEGTLSARSGLPAVIALRGLFTAAFFAGEAFVPLALTQERGFSVTQAGVSLSLASVAWAVAAWLQGRNPQWQPRAMISTGAACIVFSMLGLALVFAADLSGWAVLPMWAIGGFGMGISQPAISVAMLALAPEGRQGKASAALQLLDALGTVASLAVVGAGFAALHSGNDGTLFAGIWVALAVVAAVAAWVASRRVPLLPR